MDKVYNSNQYFKKREPTQLLWPVMAGEIALAIVVHVRTPSSTLIAKDNYHSITSSCFKVLISDDINFTYKCTNTVQ